MKLVTQFNTGAEIAKAQSKPKKKQRNFQAARQIPSLSDWVTFNHTTFSSEIATDLEKMRNRSRDASINNPFMRGYHKTLVTNVIGPAGIELRMRIRHTDTGELDVKDNQTVQTAFEQWGKNCTTDGLDWITVQNICIETISRDGEILIRLVKGASQGKYNFKIQLLEADLLDAEYNVELSNGNKVRHSIELDAYNTPVAYWLFKVHPKDKNRENHDRVRIPASELLHLFVKERPGQLRGFPWNAAALDQITHLDKYQETELIAARVSAAKMAYITRPRDANDDDLGDDASDNSTAINQEVEPGTVDILPDGYQMQMFDPTHPNGNFGSFTKVVLRSIAASLNISYHTLSGDITDASYGALRQNAIEERDTYKTIQQFIIRGLNTPVFEAWLEQSLATQAIKIPLTSYEKSNSPEWVCRKFAWLDPQREASAVVAQMNLGIKSPQDACQELGQDFNNTLDEIAFAQEQMRAKGVVLPSLAQAMLAQAQIDSRVPADAPINNSQQQ